MSRRRLASHEIQILHEAIGSDYKTGNIRLREGEYQHDLAKAIASFQLELRFPNVQQIIERLYGEEKAGSMQFRRKIQTILKKMERSSIVSILPKKTPWELQRYALSGFKFEDIDKNRVVLATELEIQQMQNRLNSIVSQQERPTPELRERTKISMLAFIVVASYVVILWDLMQPAINPIVFVPLFSIAVACSLMLGKTLSQG